MKNLGPAVTAVHDALLADRIYTHSRVIDLTCSRELDGVAQQFGFRSMTHLRDELERRTTTKVAYGFIPPVVVE